jgi:hypothetical protein
VDRGLIGPLVQNLAHLNLLKYLNLFPYQIETDPGSRNAGNDLQETGIIWAIDGKPLGAVPRHSNCT